MPLFCRLHWSDQTCHCHCMCYASTHFIWCDGCFMGYHAIASFIMIFKLPHRFALSLAGISRTTHSAAPFPIVCLTSQTFSTCEQQELSYRVHNACHGLCSFSLLVYPVYNPENSGLMHKRVAHHKNSQLMFPFVMHHFQSRKLMNK